MIFEWDEEKNHSNYMKHWVRFEEVHEIWLDEYALEFYDSDNSISEASSPSFSVNEKVEMV